jgi:hypothetical protein
MNENKVKNPNEEWAMVKCKMCNGLSFFAFIQRISKVAYHPVLLFNRLILLVNSFYQVIVKVKRAAEGKTENENSKNDCFHAYPLLKSIVSPHIEKVKTQER